MSIEDPFATAPVDEAQATPPPPPDPEPEPDPEPAPPPPAKKAPAKKAAAKVTVNNTTVEDDGNQVRITFKAGHGYDVPWLTTDYPSVAAAHEELTNIETQKQLVEVFDVVARANVAFADKWKTHAPEAPQPAAGGGGGQQQSNQRANTPRGAKQAPNGETRQCSHGEMSFNSGVSGGGKAWSGFFCPLQKGDPNQCKPQFLR